MLETQRIVLNFITSFSNNFSLALEQHISKSLLRTIIYSTTALTFTLFAYFMES